MPTTQLLTSVDHPEKLRQQFLSSFAFVPAGPAEATHFALDGSVFPADEYHAVAAAKGLSSPCVLHLRRISVRVLAALVDAADAHDGIRTATDLS